MVPLLWHFGLALALVPPWFLDCVVAIGRPVIQVQAGVPNRVWIPVASGFLYGEFQEKLPDGQKSYKVYIVTNRHVVDGLEAEGASEISIRFNRKEGGAAKEYDSPFKGPGGQSLWYKHPNPDVDVAVMPINGNVLRQEGIQFEWFRSDENVPNKKELSDFGVTEGDGVFILGFPMRLVGGERNYPIVRQGVVARIRDFLGGNSSEFLIDAFVFPGNSGGPVVLRPESITIEGTKAQGTARLLGVVRSFETYQDIAISQQTKRPRIIFEENSGLATVIPMDYVKEAVQVHLKTIGK